ncbi:MAG: hypothetical protein IT198_16835 [Acidimicrobiia bacterium]|nr:hypothetical protein [Acidimicrobiia bacterium]
MTEVVPAGRHDTGGGVGAVSSGPVLLAALLLGIGVVAALGGTAPVQRAASVFVTVIVWATPFVIVASILAAVEVPGVRPAADSWAGTVATSLVGPSRVPWFVAESHSRGGGARWVLARVGLGFVIAPTVVLAGLVAPDQFDRWLPTVAVAAAAAVAASIFASWPDDRIGVDGRHDRTVGGGAEAHLEVPDAEAGIAPRGRDDRVARCSDIIGVSYRLAVPAAAAVAIVVGLPPDTWVEWLQARPVLGIVVGTLLGLIFPPVPETVGPAFVALAPLGAGTQIAFAVPALLGNIGFGRHIAGFLPRRTGLRFCVIATSFGIAAGVWGAVAG